jgi:hypothetical protein
LILRFFVVGFFVKTQEAEYIFIKGAKILSLNLFKLISELTAKGTKDDVKANFQDNQSAQKNKNQRFLKTIVFFFICNDQL